jgi:uncharacterized BrkB/YihY/UPF0761 family membrane protein
MKSNYWHTRQQQRKAYRKQLIKAYATLVAVLLLTVAVVLL